MSLSSAPVDFLSGAPVARLAHLAESREIKGDSEISQTPYLYSAPLDLLNFLRKFTPSGALCQDAGLKRVGQCQHSLFLRRPAAPLPGLSWLTPSPVKVAALRPCFGWQGWNRLKGLVHNG